MDGLTIAPRILVVDDEPDLLSEIVAYFSRRGEVVIGAGSVSEARRIFVANHDSVRLLVSDVRMPDGDGVELVRAVLRESDGKCHCVLVTGHFEHAELDTELRAAGVQLLYKPFSFLQLYTQIVAHVAKPSEATL